MLPLPKHLLVTNAKNHTRVVASPYSPLIFYRILSREAGVEKRSVCTVVMMLEILNCLWVEQIPTHLNSEKTLQVQKL